MFKHFPARINGLQERFKFLDNFDTYVFSYEIGATKPSTKIFKELIIRAGVNADEIVFADDNNDNLDGARKVGIQAFFYEGFDRVIEKLETFGVDI